MTAIEMMKEAGRLLIKERNKEGYRVMMAAAKAKLAEEQIERGRRLDTALAEAKAVYEKQGKATDKLFDGTSEEQVGNLIDHFFNP